MFNVSRDDADRFDENGIVGKLNLNYRIDDDRMVYATWSEGFRNGGDNPVRPNSILPPEFESRTRSTNYETRRKDRVARQPPAVQHRGLLHELERLRGPDRGPADRDELGEIPAYSRSATSTCPTAEIPGVEAEFTFVVNDAWQVDATLGYNDADISEATMLTLVDDDGPTCSKGPSRKARGCR